MSENVVSIEDFNKEKLKQELLLLMKQSEVFIGNELVEGEDIRSVLEMSDEAILQGMEEAFERNKMYESLYQSKSEELLQQGLNPFPCENAVCSDNIRLEKKIPISTDNPELEGYTIEGMNVCKRGHGCHGCLFQMLEYPPNSLNYTSEESGMPSHAEALRRLEALGQLKGKFWGSQKENEYYQKMTSKACTQKDRDKEILKGITIDNFTGMLEHTLYEMFCQHKVIGEDGDPDYMLPAYFDDIDFTQEGDRQIFARNISVNLEKLMGIYPNIRVE